MKIRGGIFNIFYIMAGVGNLHIDLVLLYSIFMTV
jgi:hypothetical protein